MKKLAWLLGAIVVVFLIAAVLVPLLVDVNSYKGLIISKVKDATGRDLTLGNLHLSLWTGPEVRAEHAALSNPPGASLPKMIAMDEIEIRLAWAPLLTGRVRIAELRMIKPVVTLETLASGGTNWSFTPAATATPADTSTNGRTDIGIDSIVIEDGTFSYRDSTKKTEQEVTHIDLRASLDSLAGPFNGKGSLVIGEQKIAFEIQSGRIEPNMPFALSAVLRSGDSSVSYKGTATASPFALDGQSVIEAIHLGDLTGAPAPTGLLAQPFHAAFKVKAANGQAQLSDGTFSSPLGNGQVAATVNYQTSPLGVGARIDIAALDLDDLLSSSSGGGKSSFVLPAGVAANLQVSVARLKIAKQLIEKLTVQASLANGVLRLTSATASLPYQSLLSAKGELRAVQGAPRFSGSFQFSSANLRGLLGTAGIALDAVPANRLRQFKAAGAVSYDGQKVAWQNVQGTLDISQFSTSGAVPLDGKSGPALSLSIDAITLDDYLSARKETAKKGDPLAGLTALADRTHDAQFVLAVGALGYQGQTMRNVRVQGVLDADRLTLTRASVEEAFGMSGELSGTISMLRTTPTLAFEIAAQGRDAGAIFAHAGMKDSDLARNLGALAIKGHLAGTGERLTYTSTVSAAGIGASGTIAGDVTELTASPMTTASLDITINNPSAALAQLHVTTGAGNTGPLRVQGTAKYGGDGLTVDLTIAGLGGQARVSGGASARQYDLTMDASFPQFSALLTSLNLPVNATTATGPFAAKAKFSGTNAQGDLSKLDITWGKSQLAGHASYTTQGNRRQITAVLNGSIVDLTPFIAKSEGKSGHAWSKEKFNFGLARNNDMRLDMQIGALLLPEQRIDALTVSGELRNGILSLSRLTGKMYGGDFDLSKSEIKFGENLDVTGRGEFTNMQLEQFLKGGVAGAQVKGPISLSLDNIQGRGESQDSLVRSLSGKGAFKGTVTILGKIETTLSATLLEVLGQQIKPLQNLTGTLNTALVSYTGTPNALSGSFTMADGVLDTKDTKFTNPRASGTATGKIDLGNWLMHMIVDLSTASNQTTQAQGGHFLTLALDGPLNGPHVGVRNASTPSEAPSGNLLQQLIPGLAPPAPSATQPSQPQTGTKKKKPLIPGLNIPLPF
ncbi:MAG TPA: AsmA family protein [Dongiaceae bacterium]|jgi:uncharacterized protein involved in outer membrane biogenesis|nr:AsmA family protein [Dongiaceae bacterium]